MVDSSVFIAAYTMSFAFLLNLIFIPLLISFSHRFKVFDKEDERKIHSGPISRLGGVGIIISFALAVATSPLLLNILLEAQIFEIYMSPTRGFIISGLAVIFVVGVVDDFSNLKVPWKLLGQICAALLACASGALIREITIPFLWVTWETGVWAWPLTVLWIVGITNAINLIDGMDGLAATISTTAAAVFALVFLMEGHYFEAIFCFTLMGSLVGYLFFNYPPARIFMGDVGALFLGYTLSVIPLVAMPSNGVVLALPISMLIIPIIDVFSTLIRRKNKRVHLLHPDRDHIHHKVLELGFSERSTLAMITAVSLVSGLVVIFYFRKPDSSLRAALVLAIWLAVGMLFYASYRRRHKKQKGKDSLSID